MSSACDESDIVPISGAGDVEMLCFTFQTDRFVEADRTAISSDVHSFLGGSFSVSLFPFGAKGRSEAERNSPYCAFHINNVNNVSLDVVASVSVSANSEGSPPLTKVCASETNATSETSFGWSEFLSRRELKSRSLQEDGSLHFTIKLFEKSRVKITNPQSSRKTPRGSMLALLDDPSASHADVELRGNDDFCELVLAHRAVLCTVSDVFSSLLSKGAFKEGNTGRVTFEDISTAGLKAVVRYLYGDDLPQFQKDTIDLLLEVWCFANVNLLRELERDCERQVAALISDETFATIFEVSMSLCSNSVVRKLAAYVHSVHFQEETVERSEFEESLLKEISVENMVIFLREMPCTFITLRFAQAWVATDLSERSKLGQQVFDAFPLDELSKHDLKKKDKHYRLAARFSNSDCMYRVVLKINSAM